MSLKQNKREWEDLAELDPYWAVLTSPDGKFGAWDRAAFFETGERDIAALVSELAESGRPARMEAALDFGCGLGRLSRALSTRFGSVTGVDISAGMIKRAEELNADRPNCRFLHNPVRDLSAIPSDSQDLVFSHIALQHIPDASAILAYIREFVRVGRPDGIVVFQLLSGIPMRMRLQPRRRLYHLLRGVGFAPGTLYRRFGLTPMTVNCVPEAEVVATATGAGGNVVKIKPDTSAGPGIESRVYWIVKERGE